MVYKDPKQVLVSYCLQFLLILLLYPIPEGGGPPPKNFFRHFLGRLHRPQDFQFIVDGMMRTLNQPVGQQLSVARLLEADGFLATSFLFIFTREPKVIEMGTRDDYVVLGNIAV